jgi:tetratricopeptide (TPR) repeat protein
VTRLPAIHVLLLALAIAGVPGHGALAGETERTLEDLRREPPPIRAGERVAPDAQRARELYRGFLQLEGGDPELRREALRRLGDLELEAAEAARAEGASPDAGRVETEAAIAIYVRLLEEDPHYPRSDEVLYQLARAWEAQGEPDRALDYLGQLVARHPASRHGDEAQFRRGEILFSAQRWREAEEAYAAVIASGETSEFFEQALYKHGWAMFKQSQVEASAASFLALLDRKLASDPGSDGAVALEAMSRADREMVEDTFRALAIEFAAMDVQQGLDAAVAAHGSPPYAWMLYGSLGDMLVEKERFTDAADTYRAFARRDPVHRRSPELQARAVEAYLAGGFADLALEGKREFVRQYAFDGPFWVGRERDDAPEVVAQLKAHLQDMARYHHALAQASGAPADYREAADWYRDYLRSFPDEPDSAETNYLLADTLYESGSFGEAALEYERTAYGYPPGERSASAGYAALVSYDQAEAVLPDGEARAAWHRQAIDSALRFADTFPSHPEAGRMRLRSAQQLFNLGEYELAANAATAAVVHVPVLSPEELRTAWNVAADAQFQLGRFDAAEGAYLEVLGRTPAGDPARQDLEERLAASIYKQGEAKQAAGDVVGAIEDFLRVGVLAPGSSVRANAQFDAAALLVQQEQWERAIPVLESFRRDHPDNPLAETIPQSLAVAYLEVGRPIDAAIEFERLADSSSEPDEVRRTALVQAAELYEQGGDAARTAAAWERFVERYPMPLDDAMGARVKLADMAGGAGDPVARDRWLGAIVAADAAAGTSRTDSSRSLAAHAALELAEPKRAAFDAIVLAVPLAQSLKAKRAAMEQALDAYRSAADYGIADVTTAATFETAEIYGRLATDLMASERPEGLDAEELEQYDLLLEEQAYPFEEKAIDLHEQNASRAAQGFYDEYVRRSYEALAGLKPARYAKQETLPTPDAGPAPAPELEQALSLATAGDWEGAEPAFLEALDPVPGAPALTGLGLAYRHAGRFALAERAYQDALAADPGYGPAMLNLGVLLDLYLQRPAEALAHYQAYQATLVEPDERTALWIREVELRAGDKARSVGVNP